MADIQGIAGQIARIREKSNALIDSELKQRGIRGIVPAHGPILFFLLQQSEPVPIKAVVEKVGRAKSTVTVMVATLERHGYLRRLPCRADNRVILIELTAAGRKLRGDFEQISQKLLDKLYGQMSPDARQALVQQLTIVEANLSR